MSGSFDEAPFIGTLETDVLIVGSGPIAALYAREILDRTGAKILMVDAGAASSPVPGAHLKNTSYFQKDVNMFAGVIKADIHPTSISVDTRVEDTLGSNAFRPPFGSHTQTQNPEQDPTVNLSGAGATYKVGGMGTHWTASCPMMHKEEMGMLLNYVSEQEMKKLYERAYERFDVTQAGFDTSIRQDTVLEALKKEYGPDEYENGRGPQPLPLSLRRRVSNQEFVEWGSTATILGQYAKPEVIHIAQNSSMAVNTRNRFRILEQHICRKLVMEDVTQNTKKIKHAVLHNMLRNEKLHINAKKYIICCGTVLSAQLLHVSGLGNGEAADFLPALGRYLTEQPIAFCQIVLKRQLVTYIQQTYSEQVDEFLQANPGEGIPIPYDDPDPQCWFPFSPERPWHCQIHRDAFTYGDLPPNVDGRLIVDLRWFTRTKPTRDTRVKFSTNPRNVDLFGMPQPIFDFNPGEHDREETANAMRDMVRCASALGSFLPGSSPQWMKPGLSLHIHGVTRMGSDRSTSVVDPYCKVHGVEDLYVGGLGVLPCEASCNPTITAAAMALRSVDSIIPSLPPKQAIPRSFGSPIFSEKILATVEDGYWIDSFDANGNGFPDILAYGLNVGSIRLYLNPGASCYHPDAAKWDVVEIAKLHQPVGAAHGDINGNGRVDLAICCEYGNTMATINMNGGEIYWLENPGGDLSAARAWKKRFIGKIPGMHRMELGYFTQKNKLELLALPVVSTEGNVLSASNVKLFQQPDDVENATEWSAKEIESDYFHVIHAVQKGKFMQYSHPPSDLDTVLLGSMEGVTLLYFDKDASSFKKYCLVKGLENAPNFDPVHGTPEFHGVGNLAVGRYGDDPYAFIATLEPFHGNVLNLYTRHHGTPSGEMLHSKWQAHNLAVFNGSNIIAREGQGDGHHVIAADMDGDGNDEFMVALRDKGVMYYQIIDLHAGRVLPTYVTPPIKGGSRSAARIAINDFDQNGTLDFATIGYNVKDYYEANPCQVNLYANEFAFPAPSFDSPDIELRYLTEDELKKIRQPDASGKLNLPNAIKEAGVILPNTIDCIKRKFLLKAHCYIFEIVVMPQNARWADLPEVCWVKVISGNLIWEAQDFNDTESVNKDKELYFSRRNVITPQGIQSMKIQSDTHTIFAAEETVFMLMTPAGWHPNKGDVPKIERDNDGPRMDIQTGLIAGREIPMKFYKFHEMDESFSPDLEFYNMSGFTVYKDGVHLSHIQWWLAGSGVDARTHNHSELDSEHTFCEIHACLVNATGDGGMYRNENDDGGNQSKLIVPTGAEHGPLWEVEADGKPQRNQNGGVNYRGHKWKAGGIFGAQPEMYDFWMAFELNPDIAIVKP